MQNLNVMFLLWLKLSATYILLPLPPLNVIERKFKRQILKPDPIILANISIKYLLSMLMKGNKFDIWISILEKLINFEGVLDTECLYKWPCLSVCLSVLKLKSLITKITI